jgi:flavodoxin
MSHDTLIICYTRSGTTAVAARQLARLTGWRIGWVRDVEARLDLMGALRCVIEGALGLGARYVYRGPKPGRYRHVVLMSPIWMGSMASPLRRFIAEGEKSRDAGDHLPASVSCIHVMAGRNGQRAAEQTARLLHRPVHPVLALREKDVLNGAAYPQLIGFAHDVRALEADMSPTVSDDEPWLSVRAL